MRILILAPHPFYQERGTPIAVDLLVQALSERGDTVELLTFHEGADRSYPNFSIHRIKPFPEVRNVRPGFSLKKIYCDLFLFFRFVSLFFRSKYDIVHAVEESAFMAMMICPLRSVPFIYDVDSSMTTQLVDKLPVLRPVRGVLRFLESLPMRYAAAVVPMCDALADEARNYRSDNIVVLKDVSLIDEQPSDADVIDLKEELALTGKVVMYIGNLESYQGIDLLLESFQRVCKRDSNVDLVIIGGADTDGRHYKGMAEQLGIGASVHLLGPRSVGLIGQYMKQADILVSPRTQGANTPMKIYSYLDSGRAVLATRLPTHTQVLDDSIAMLAEPNSRDFADAMLELLADDELQSQLAAAAKEKMEKEHSYPVFRTRVHELYSLVDKSIP